MPSRPVVIDTNFLLVPFQFKINIMADLNYLIDIPYHYIISSSTIKELEKLAKNSGKKGASARLALKLVEANKNNLQIIENHEHVDDWIVKYAKEHNAIVCTNDSKLRKRLKGIDIKVITVRSKSRIGFV